VYEVYNLSEAIEKLTQTTLRNVVGSMDLDETLVSRDTINTRLRIILDEATDKWGVKVNRVELQEVNPPADIRHAMEKQMRAERERREMILRSEGQKSSAILEAEGSWESQVLRARGEAEARVLRATGEAEARLKMAEAESQAILLLKKVSPDHDPMPYLLALQYVQALPKMTEGKDNKMIIVPYEASSLVSSLATIKKMFTETEK
jgi:regulator of protease activity HflC (stomatin/prohibitin superfamily)